MFEPYLKKWHLRPDGNPIVSHNSRLLPVRMKGRPAMLKIAMEAEEKFGGQLMAWWEGDGAARVYAREGDALLMERAEGHACLLEMALKGRDDEASRIACRIIGRLHAPRERPPPALLPLAQWFEALAPAAQGDSGILLSSAVTARELLASPRDVGALHGDVHHGNILDFGARGWLAIDPKGLVGERGFDYANLLCNPELTTATDPARFARQLDVIVEAAGLERRRLLRWVLAYAGLSASWFLEDGKQAAAACELLIAGLAARALADAS